MRRIMGAAVGVAMLAAACTTAGDGTTTTTTTSPSTSTTEQVTTTTTTEPTTTTTSESTTTTGQPGTLVLAEGAVIAGATPVPFGTVDEVAVDAISSVLGEPTEDSGWIDAFSVYGTCPLPLVRGIHWDGFVALFTQADTEFATGGVPHFFSWYYPYGDDIGLETEDGISVGSTVAQLQATYTGPDFILVPWEFDETQGFWSTNQFDSAQLYGYTTGLDPSDTVTSVSGGTGCGE